MIIDEQYNIINVNNDFLYLSNIISKNGFMRFIFLTYFFTQKVVYYTVVEKRTAVLLFFRRVIFSYLFL